LALRAFLALRGVLKAVRYIRFMCDALLVSNQLLLPADRRLLNHPRRRSFQIDDRIAEISIKVAPAFFAPSSQQRTNDRVAPPFTMGSASTTAPSWYERLHPPGATGASAATNWLARGSPTWQGVKFPVCSENGLFRQSDLLLQRGRIRSVSGRLSTEPPGKHHLATNALSRTASGRTS